MTACGAEVAHDQVRRGESIVLRVLRKLAAPKAMARPTVDGFAEPEAWILTPVQLPRRQVAGSPILVPVLVILHMDERLLLGEMAFVPCVR